MFTCTGMYDVALSLTAEDRVVGNDIAADGNTLVMITGATRVGSRDSCAASGLPN